MRMEKNIINYLTTQYFSTSTMVFALSKCVSVQKRKFQTSLTGLEPARQYGNSVLNYLLNHSDTTTRYR